MAKTTPQAVEPTHSLPDNEWAVSTAKAQRPGLAVYAATGLSLVAALIHLWAAPEHLEEWWGYGAFFLAAAFAQGLLGVLLLLGFAGQLVPFAGVWGNLAIISMYVVTRTSGVPVGPHAGIAEDAGVPDMAATAAGLGLAVMLVTLLRGRLRRWTVSALLLAGILAWALRLTGGLS